MGFGGEVPGAVLGFGQVGLDDDVVGFGFARGDFVAGEVGDAAMDKRSCSSS
jgi:hypothetical protein